jgi:hypothetical protein
MPKIALAGICNAPSSAAGNLMLAVPIWPDFSRAEAGRLNWTVNAPVA